MDTNLFAERIKELRTARQETQRDVYGPLGMHATVYSRYESGRREPAIDALIAISDHFDVSTDYLLGRTDDPSRH